MAFLEAVAFLATPLAVEAAAGIVLLRGGTCRAETRLVVEGSKVPMHGIKQVICCFGRGGAKTTEIARSAQIPPAANSRRSRSRYVGKNNATFYLPSGATEGACARGTGIDASVGSEIAQHDVVPHKNAYALCHRLCTLNTAQTSPAVPRHSARTRGRAPNTAGPPRTAPWRC